MSEGGAAAETGVRRGKATAFLESKLVILVVGFLLTGVVGQYLTSRHDERQWEREKRLELLSRRLDETQEAIDQVTLHMRRRWYVMQRVFWKLESYDGEAAERIWTEEYEPVKDEWIVQVYIYRNKLEKLLREDLAHQLVDAHNSRDYAQPGERGPRSVHTHFVRAHTSLKKLLRHDGTGQATRMELYDLALADLRVLSERIDALTENIFDAYLSGYTELRSDFVAPNAVLAAESSGQ